MHNILTNRNISAALSILMCMMFIGMWGIYLFVGNGECADPCEMVKDSFLYAIDPSHDGSLLFQASLVSIVICAAIAIMALISKNLVPATILGLVHALMSLYLYTWSDGLLAVAVVLPLIIETKNA